MKILMQKLGKHSIEQARSEGRPTDALERMARLEASRAAAGALTNLGRAVALAAIVLGGIAVAASFLAPGLALAGSLPTNATGAHPWIVDGGGEIADNFPRRLEITVEYIGIGITLIFVSLRFGKVWLAKLQDWYEAAPVAGAEGDAELEPLPSISQFPAPLRRPTPRTKAANGKNSRHELHAA
jgi:hypothetical protein